LNCLADEEEQLSALEPQVDGLVAPTCPTSALGDVPPAAPAAAAAAAPAPHQQTRSNALFNALKKKHAAKLAAGSSRTATKRIRNLDTNVVSVKLGFLKEQVQMATGDPIFCSCAAALSSVDTLSSNIADLSPDGASSTTNSSDEPDNNDPDNKFWRCSFCNKVNSALISEEEVPSAPIVDYIQEVPASSGAATEERSSIVFCIDISGSMCVTSEIAGKVELRGNAKSTCGSFVDDQSDQYFPGQRRDVTYVSRLQSVQAAVDSQLENLSKLQPNTTVGLGMLPTPSSSSSSHCIA
jgi:hypothetical protein